MLGHSAAPCCPGGNHVVVPGTNQQIHLNDITSRTNEELIRLIAGTTDPVVLELIRRLEGIAGDLIIERDDEIMSLNQENDRLQERVEELEHELEEMRQQPKENI